MGFSVYGVAEVIWAVLPAFQFGWHISALNMIQSVLTCRETGGGSGNDVYSNLPACIPMSTYTFSLITSLYTVGGLIGSLSASHAMDNFGRKRAVSTSTIMFLTGASIMASARGTIAFGIGRLFCGLGAGIGLCVVPVFLAEIAPVNARGAVGVLNQLAIVFGILSTQAVGMNYAVPSSWRHVLSVSSGISLVHFFVGLLMVESPVWLKSHGKKDEAARAVGRLWTQSPDIQDINDPLLSDPNVTLASQEEGAGATPVHVYSESPMEVIMTMEYRRPLTIVSLLMIAQQISGINAVLYYSTDIMSKIVPASAAWISLMITIVNALMTLPAIALIERLGRLALLKISAMGILATLIVAAFSIDFGFSWLASLAVLGFVASFAVGMGPVPYVIITDVAPAKTVGAMSTIALSLNWITNFVVAILFLPLRDMLASGDAGQGRVFYVFAAAFATSFVLFSRLYVR